MSMCKNSVRGFNFRPTEKIWGTQFFDRFEIAIYCEGGGVSGEFSIVWEELGGEYIPKLHVYSDGWATLVQFSDLVDALGTLDVTKFSPSDLRDLLLSLGIIDRGVE